MRSDKLKNIAKVTKAVIKDPLKSVREIESETGVSKSTVAVVKSNLDNIGQKDDRILGICDKDLDIVKLGQEIILSRLNDKAEIKKMRTSEVSSVIRENTARYTLFKGDATDNEGGTKQPDVVFQIVDPNQEKS